MNRFGLKGIPRPSRGFSTRDYTPGQPIPTFIMDQETGKIVVNPLKRWVVPFALITDPASITLAGNAVSDPIPLVIDGKGHLEIFDAWFQSSQAAGFTVTLFDADSFGADQRPLLMNREVHVATIASGAGVTLPISGTFGTATSGGRPYRWPETYWMDVSKEKRGAMIVAIFRNLSSSSNTIRFGLSGRRWYYMKAEESVARRMEQIFRERPRSMPFFYTTDEIVSLAGLGGPTDFQIRMGDDGWTEWIKSSSKQDGNFTCNIRDASDGKQVMTQGVDGGNQYPIHNTCLFGSGELPFWNWETSLFQPNFKLFLQLTDLSGSTNNIWITLGCRKIFSDPLDEELLRPGHTPGKGMD